MANSGFLWTDVGLAASSAALPGGPYIHVASFRLASGFGYSPTRSMTSLTGTILHTGTPSTYTVVNENELDVVLPVDVNVGDFQFGEIGLYDSGNVLLAVCVFDELQEKARAVGNQAGNRYRIHARVKLAQAPAIVIVSVANPMSILEVPSWQTLYPPVDQLNDNNVVIVQERDASDDPILVIRETDTEWGIQGFRKVFEGTMTSGFTSRASSGTYISSTGAVVSAGTDVARMTHNPVTLAPLGLLIEDASINVFKRSALFSDTVSWTLTQATLGATTTAPDGTATGIKLLETTANAVHSLAQSVDFVTGQWYAFSFFVKAAERTVAVLNLPDSIFGSGSIAHFDTTAGSVSVTPTSANGTAYIEQHASGWWRCVYVDKALSTATGTAEVTPSSTSAGSNSYVGVATSGIFVWGAMMEAGINSNVKRATSYIPTTTIAVSRAADVATRFNTSEIILAGIGPLNLRLPQTGSRYVIKFDTGDIRKITSTSCKNSVIWSPALGYTPGGTAKIYVDNAVTCCDSGMEVATLGDYNMLAAGFNRFWSTPTGTFNATNAGLNETALPILTSRPGLGEWQLLTRNLRRLMTLQNYTSAQVNKIIDSDWLWTPSSPVSLAMMTKQFGDLVTTVTESLDNSRNTLNLAQTESAEVVSLARSRTLPWLSNVIYEFTVDYASTAAREGFANGGGAIIITPLSGTETTFFEAWDNLYDEIGTVVMDRGTTASSLGATTGSSLGILNLTGSYQTVFTRDYVSGTLSATLTMLVEARHDGNNIRFRLTFTFSGSPYSTPDPGTMSVSVFARRPLATLIDYPAMSYPTGTQLGTSTY